MSDQPDPIIRFHRLLPAGRLPIRADRAAMGTLPVRAVRYCEAATSATSYGWWVFSPIDQEFLWDGSDIFWRCKDVPEWVPLQPSVQFPDYSEAFDRAAPAAMQGCAPPFLTALPEPGCLQIWTGLIAQTAPDWHLLVRSTPNLPSAGGIGLFEGIIETDRWFGPLFINLRLTKTNTPISFSDEFPLFQVQPIPRDVYDDATLNNYELVPRLDQFQPEDWDDFYDTVVRPHVQSHRPRGQYATAARKRRAQGDDGASG